MRARPENKGQVEKRGLLNVEAAAEILGVQVSTLYAWAEQERVPHVRLGRALRFDPEALRRWIDQNTVHPQDR